MIVCSQRVLFCVSTWIVIFGDRGMRDGFADVPVHLEVVQFDRGAVDGPQEWLRRLQKLPLASIRIRASRPGDSPQLIQKGSAEQPVFYVTAILTRRNELRLPDRIIRPGNLEQLSAWLSSLESAVADQKPSGPMRLTDTQRTATRRDLASPLGRMTRDVGAESIVRQIEQRSSLPIVIDRNARRVLSEAGRVHDELQGLAEGTVLAAVLSPLGLAIVPTTDGQSTVTLHIRSSRGVHDAWPVGWPTPVPAQQSIPKLFDFLPVEIVDTPLSSALRAIQPRIGVPLLLDHAGLAAQQIDPDMIKVRYPSGRTFYKRLLDRLLFQARLEAEIRVDDGNRPLIWIQPIRR